MSKVLVVIDDPKTCGECPCCMPKKSNGCVDFWCRLNIEEVELYSKSKNCPLVEMPEKHSSMYGYDHGWNNCLNEILKNSKVL